MTSADMTLVLRRQILDEIDIESVSDSKFALGIPLVYPDGDSCEIWLSKQNSNGTWLLSDEGDVVNRAEHRGVDLLASDRVNRLTRTVGFYGVVSRGGALTMDVEEDQVGTAIYSFAQACVEALGLTRFPAQRKAHASKRFRDQLFEIVSKTIPIDKIARQWHHPTLDEARVHPVDLRIEGGKSPWYLMGIASELWAYRDALSLLHFKANKDKFRGLVIFENRDSLAVAAAKSVDEVADKSFSSINEEEAIHEFLSNEVLCL